MKLPDRKQTEVRRLLESGQQAPVPPDLAERAVLRGTRLARRRRAVQFVLWTFFAVAVGFAVWAVVAAPWAGEPASTTPPVGW